MGNSDCYTGACRDLNPGSHSCSAASYHALSYPVNPINPVSTFLFNSVDSALSNFMFMFRKLTLLLYIYFVR